MRLSWLPFWAGFLSVDKNFEFTINHGLKEGGGGGGLGGVRGVRVVTGVLNLKEFSLQTVLSGGQLVLEVGQLGGVSLSLNFSDQLLDGGFLVLHNGHLVGAVGGLELLKK
ncbi:hypothetical protein TYRP_014857 [Tyrophagus putrescentiae]|nr:hypothetical protein TYRP_014857 [Tyrophagus putrescentiae]